jgi:hypothetical protein
MGGSPLMLSMGSSHLRLAWGEAVHKTHHQRSQYARPLV